jgi:transposase
MSDPPELLPGMPEAGPAPQAPAERPPLEPARRRIRTAARQQIELVPRSLEDSLPSEHPARQVWALVERLELDDFYAAVQSALGGPGRPASDPQVLLALWIYATVDGVGSARRLDRLCREQDAYRWLRGGVPVNYHLLSDFRTGHRAALDDLLTQTITVLLHQELITLETVAQDGIRVRASAGNSSFRRRATLERCQREAAERVAELARQADGPDPTISRKQQAARQRAARERLRRLDAALEELPAVEALKEQQRKKKSAKDKEKVTEARVSMTDPEARVLHMADGGFRPAYNVQEVTDGATRAILAVDVSNAGSDGGLAPGLEAQVAERCGGQHPRHYLIDGGLTDQGTITALDQRQVTVYGPPQPPKSKQPEGRTIGEARSDDPPAVAAWRARMATDEGQTIYRERGALAEWTHAQWRTRHGLQQFRVRGIDKVTSVVLLIAVTHNLLQWARLNV